MKKWFSILLLTSAITLSAGYQKGEELYGNEFSSGNALGGAFANAFVPDSGLNKDGAFRIYGANGSNFITIKLDEQKLKGIIYVEAVVKGSDIKKAEKPYWGSKVMLVIKRKDGTVKYAEPAMLKRYGDFDWSRVMMIEQIPMDVESVTIMLGLQNTTGVFSVDSLKIFRGVKENAQ